MSYTENAKNLKEFMESKVSSLESSVTDLQMGLVQSYEQGLQADTDLQNALVEVYELLLQIGGITNG